MKLKLIESYELRLGAHIGRQAQQQHQYKDATARQATNGAHARGKARGRP